MHKFVKRAVALCLGMLFILSSSALAMPDIMKLSDVRPGMRGVAYTVVDATGELKTMDVEILGTIGEAKGEGTRIIARLSGPVADAADGLASGMSGSPVYIDGKLVGATSATMKEIDRHTCMITPIEGMLAIWNMPDTKNKTQVRSVDIKRAAEEREKARAALDKKAAALDAKHLDVEKKKAALDAKQTAEAAEKAALEAKKSELEKEKAELEAEKAAAEAEEKEQKPQQPSDKNTAAPAKNSDQVQHKDLVYAAGFSSSGLSFLKKQMEPVGITAAGVSTAVSSGQEKIVYGASLKPGESMGAAIVFGDFFVGATGTVTAADGQRVLGFGHQFLHRGNVNYFLTNASVMDTVHGTQEGRKLVASSNIIGRVNQDREMGIAGIIGVFPMVVPLHVTVHDEDQGRSETYNVSIAYDEDFLPNISASIAYASMDRLIDRLSGSTAKVHFVIRTNVAEGGKIERDNMYYNLSDVGQIAVNELGQALNIICSNMERESDIFDIKVDVTVSSQRRTASLISAVPDKSQVKPGETVYLKTTIKPYRRSKEILTIPYTVPRGQRLGPVRLDVRGGGLIPVSQLILAQQAAAGIDVTAEEDKTVSTTAKLKDYLSADRNNEIVVTPSASPAPMSEAEQKAAVRLAVKAAKEEAAAEPETRKGKHKAPAQTKYTTDYIIDNVVHASFQVIK